MKRLIPYLLIVIPILVFSHFSWAQCPQDPNDLGICDTIYIETFDCDHIYSATGGYDSVRVAIYVTHDSNTIPSGPYQGVQDSIVGFTVPLNFWKQGCADSVIFPGASPWHHGWNNVIMDSSSPEFKRSMFRHLVDACVSPPETTFNRFALMNSNGRTDWLCHLDVVKHDPGHVYLGLLPATSTCQRWWEGSRVLLATLTFLVYMAPSCESTAICLDSAFWAPSAHLEFVRHDYQDYFPRHFLPVCDTIYYVKKYGDCNGDGIIDISDVVYLRNYLYHGGPAPQPLAAGDANCDGVVDTSDVVYLINYLFVHGPAPGC